MAARCRRQLPDLLAAHPARGMIWEADPLRETAEKLRDLAVNRWGASRVQREERAREE
jgi:hypothetical protein